METFPSQEKGMALEVDQTVEILWLLQGPSGQTDP